MKTNLTRIFSCHVLLSMIALLSSQTTNAQDPFLESIDLPEQVIFANQNTEIVLTLGNLSPVQVNDVMVQIDIFDLGGNPVFQFMTQPTMPLVIPGGGQIQMSTLPVLWYPTQPGEYQLFVQVLSVEDQDPSNNFGETVIIAEPQPPVQLEQIDLHAPFLIPNSLYGNFCIDFPPLPDPLFVNVIAANPVSSDADWVVRNMPLLPFHSSHMLCYWFDLGLLGYVEGDNVDSLDIAVRLDPFTLDAPFFNPQFMRVGVDDFIVDIPSDNPAEVIPIPPVSVTFPTYAVNQQLTWLYRGCDMPNIDLDSSKHKPSPTYAGDWNACGPAAAANSMQWLEDTHPLIPPTGTTHRQKMESLSGHMGRGNEQGVTTTQLIQGKLGYIDEHMLPIHVKYQSWFLTDSTVASPNGKYGHKAENKGSTTDRKPPTWEFLKSEMEKGEDVEIMFGWYDKDANRHGGHWVTVTGVSENTEYKGIYIKDDSEQKDSTGTRQKYLNWHTDGDWSRLLGFDGPNNYCWVESVVSESYDPNITYLVFDFKLDWLDWESPVITPDPLLSFFTFSYPSSLDTAYLNILANVPDSNEVWMGRNIMLPPRDTIEEVALWWDLANLGLEPGHTADTIHLKLTVGSTINETPVFSPTYELDITIDTTDYYIGNGSPDNVPRFVPFMSFSKLPFDSTKATKYVYRGCEMPNIDLDSTTNNPTTMPSYAGDKNACGPAAAANSMQWLEDNNPNLEDTGTSHRDKLKELSEGMDRAPNGGVFRKDFIEGKLAYIDNHKLPIHVKFQGIYFNKDSIPSPDTLYDHFAENKNDSAFAKPQWDWLFMEMEKGEDVEVEFGYYDSTGMRKGGHWITITGVVEIGGKKRIYYKDDTDQKKKGGMRHECATWRSVASANGLTYLPELSGKKYIAVVESVVSESYDPAITFCPDDILLDQTSIPSGDYFASEIILLSGTIESGADVYLSAPIIQLLDNFHIETGATLLTSSVGCP